MQVKRPMLFAAVFACLFITIPLFAASKENVLYSFKDDGADGAEPYASLIPDHAGNLYGTTDAGGTYGYGTVFELTPGANGTWTEAVLYSFCAVGGCADGASPLASLILDGAGNLYGTTYSGGANGGGGVFQLAPEAGGTWMETTLYSFCAASGCTDGTNPQANLIFDAVGNLYSTTSAGGTGPCKNQNGKIIGCGTVFELIPSGNGIWAETVLYSFTGHSNDGAEPLAGVIFDPAGNLYGTTSSGGASHRAACVRGYACGTVFQLEPGENGKWTEKVLYSFCSATGCADGRDPVAGLTFDAAGNLYGTTNAGGGYEYEPCLSRVGCGAAFELTPGANGKWKEKTLHAFNGGHRGSDGGDPYAGLVFGAAGELYGTTALGGEWQQGTVFQLKPGSNGKWSEAVRHSFGQAKDGAGPNGGLIVDATGNLYGTTVGGGAYGHGTVFEIIP